MTVERTSTEIILHIPSDFDKLSIQKILNFLKYKETIKGSQADELQVKMLADESKSNWWKENKTRFIK